MKNNIFIVVLSFILTCPINAYAEDLDIPTDPTGHYEIILLEKPSADKRILATKRTGTSGVSYSKILIDCKTRKFGGLGEGDTIEEMNAGKPTKEMFPLVEGSIKYYQVNYACSK